MLEGGCNKKDCIYRSTNRGKLITFDYMFWTYKRRGCPIGDECTKYTPGERNYNWMSSFVFLPKDKD